MLIAAAVGLLLGAGVVTATILLLRDDDSTTASAPQGSSTVPAGAAKVPVRTGTASSSTPSPGAPVNAAAGAIEAGRYVQAGSFRTVAGAEEEQQRLEAEGADVSVVESDLAQELYPGFQVLLGGPFFDRGSERALLRQLRENGVPSAFGRDLSPATTISGPAEIAGQWAGTLERTGSEKPSLDGPLQVTLMVESDGRLATLDVPSANCAVDLQLETATAISLTYGPAEGCLGPGDWRVRPHGESLSMTLLPPDSEEIVLGELQRR
jgi:hypothetical protein